jgi:hypothetical protein
VGDNTITMHAIGANQSKRRQLHTGGLRYNSIGVLQPRDTGEFAERRATSLEEKRGLSRLRTADVKPTLN